MQNLDILAFLLILPALYLLGEKKKICFIIFSLSSLIMIYVAVITNLYGLLLMQVVYLGFNIINWFKWSNKHEEKS